MEKASYFLMILCTLALRAAAANERISILEQQMDQIYTDTARDTFGAKAASARPQLDSYGIYVSADALYWKAFEGGTDYLTKVKAINSATAPGPIVGHSIAPEFNWQWGFRTELGYRTDHDDWDVAAHFTWFYDKANSTVNATAGEQLFSLFFQPVPLTFTLNAATSDLWLHVYDGDLCLQKSYFLSRNVSITSLAALRATWINQKAHTFTSGNAPPGRFINLDLSEDSDFWGIGPKIGFSPRWFIGPHWNIFGAFAGSLLYGEFDVRSKALFVGRELANPHDNFHQIVPAAQGALGFGWETNSFCNRYHVAINVTYEAQYWWRQNQWFSYLSPDNPTMILKRLGGDLGLQGLTLNALFDF